jgi:hypothetical protein
MAHLCTFPGKVFDSQPQKNVHRKRADASGRQPARGSSDSNSVVLDATCLIQCRQEQLNERKGHESLEPETTSIRIRDTSGEEQLQRSVIDLDAIFIFNEDTLRFRDSATKSVA